ncbi:hypothetical protein HY025_01850 [Candidatus Daviesbacteria bacterium]|nr:hypothetical protein [Candidatus Daviesbacteria bacterium]
MRIEGLLKETKEAPEANIVSVFAQKEIDPKTKKETVRAFPVDLADKGQRVLLQNILGILEKSTGDPNRTRRASQYIDSLITETIEEG